MLKFPATVAQILTTVVLMAVAGGAAAQLAYPSRPIHIIVPLVTGGTTDILARLAGQKLAESWGQQVIVENRPGGNGIIGGEALVKSPPDGYTLLLMSTTYLITPHLLPTPYDVIKDFAPVATLASGELMLILNPSVPANTLQEFIALARSKPGQINYATTGTGNVTHLGIELFSIMAGVKMQHIPYKGGAPALTDLLGGRVQMYFAPPASSIAHIKSGKLKAVAISGEIRLAALPQVPTFAEAGLPGFDAKTWYGIVARTGAPKEVIDKTSAEIAKILVMPDTREKLVGQGAEPFISNPEQFAALIRADFAKYARIIKTANIKLEQ